MDSQLFDEFDQNEVSWYNRLEPMWDDTLLWIALLPEYYDGDIDVIY